MSDEMDNSWPPNKRRVDDQVWFSTIRRYESIILLGIVIVMLVTSILAWMDRRDTDAIFRALHQAISDLTAQAAASSEKLTQVKETSETLAGQNARWYSMERELDRVSRQSELERAQIVELTARVQRIEDQRKDAKGKRE